VTEFYFIRHGQINSAERDTKFYHGRGTDMLTLSKTGVEQITALSTDARLKKANLIVTSPYGRALHSAAILSRLLNVPLEVETNLHEWMADIKGYDFIPYEQAVKNYVELRETGGVPEDENACPWETLSHLKRRVFDLMEKYSDMDYVIFMCHGTLMQYVFDIPHPDNAEVYTYLYAKGGNKNV